MNQESHIDVDGALSRMEDIEQLPVILPPIIVESNTANELEVGVLVGHPNPGLEPPHIPEVENEVYEARPVDQPGFRDVHQQDLRQPPDAAAELANALRAFQEQDIQSFGRYPRRLEVHQAEDYYFSDNDQDSEDDQVYRDSGTTN